jgi:hypothetical protein
MAENVCAYCGNPVLTGREKPEHPIPAALGSSLKVSTVCDPCNEATGRYVDQPFLSDPLVRESRSSLDQRDPRRGSRARRPASAFLAGHTEEGDFVSIDRDTGRPVMGSRVIDLGDDRTQVRASTMEEAERLLEKVRKKAAAEGKSVEVEPPEHSESQSAIKVLLTIYPELWRREAAKIALGVCSVVYPAAWRTSGDAERLREWMDGRDTSMADGKAPPLIPEQIELGIPLASEDEHLIFFKGSPEGSTYLVVTLFGSLSFGVPVDTTGGAVPNDAWRLDWRHPRRDGRTTRAKILMDAAEKVVRENNDLPALSASLQKAAKRQQSGS